KRPSARPGLLNPYPKVITVSTPFNQTRLKLILVGVIGLSMTALAGCDQVRGVFGQQNKTTGPTVKVTDDPFYGPILTDGAGRSLYKYEAIFEGDECS